MSRSLFGRAALIGLLLPLASCVAEVDTIEDEGPIDEAAVPAHPDEDIVGSQIQLVEGTDAPTTEALVVQTPGLDVSGYQGNVNWTGVRANGGRFAYIKATESTT